MSSAQVKGSEAPQVLRPLGILESYFYTRSQLGVDSCVIVAARYESSSGRPLDQPTLFAALEQVVDSNAELVSRVFCSTSRGERAWVRLPSLDLNRIVTFLDVASSELQSVMETEFTRSFELREELPMWRLTILSDGVVVYAYDHTMGDGQSGLAFHLSLVAALQNVQSCSSHTGIVASSGTKSPLHPPLEAAMHIPMSLTRLAREVNQAINPYSRRQRSALWTGNPVTKTFKFGVNVRILRLSPQETTRLLQRCRSHQTTLTGALYALMWHVFSHLVPTEYRRGYIAVFVPVSLRKYTGAPPTAMCNHVSYHQNIYQLREPLPHHSRSYPSPASFPWKAAVDFSEELKRKAPKTPTTIGVMKLLVGRDLGESYNLGQLGKKREMTLEISNLGPVPVSHAQDPSSEEPLNGPAWSIRDTVFAQADATLGAALKMNVTGMPEGGLGIALSWGKDALEEALAEECVTAFSEGLNELAAAEIRLP